MAVYSKIAIVTGANKGIGFAIVRNLALQYPQSPLNTGNFLIYLTARSASRGEDAVKALLADKVLKDAKVLQEDGGSTSITFRSLDISDESSIHSFRDFIKQEHPDGIDILINNAGIAMDGFDDHVVKSTIHTNYYGTLAMTRDFLPLIHPGGRLVNVASSAGRLSAYSATLKKAFIEASETSVEKCSALMERFAADVAAKQEKAKGWPSAAYAVSKAGEIAMTKAIAKDEEKNGRGVLINACCPGYVNTDMTKGNGSLTVDEGAKTPVLLALSDFGGSSGGFWRGGHIIEW